MFHSLQRFRPLAAVSAALLIGLTGLTPFTSAFADARVRPKCREREDCALPRVIPTCRSVLNTTRPTCMSASADLDAFVNSFIATFGGKASPRAVFTVTPTPSRTASQYVQTPVGMLSVFGFENAGAVSVRQ